MWTPLDKNRPVTLAESLIARIPIVEGIGDMWTVFQDGDLFAGVIEALARPYRDAGVTKVVGIEARGFVLGAAVANTLGAGFVGIRKPGGLYPGETFEGQTPPDYRGNEFVLRLQKNALSPTDRVILVDDWFETGGQAGVAVVLIAESEAKYLGASVVVDWMSNATRERLSPVHSILDMETLPTRQ